MNTNNIQAPQLPQTAVNHSVLTLEHLAPYLPFKIEGLNPFNEKNKIIGLKNETYFIENGNTYAYGDIRDCRLILKPLSDFYDINAPAFIDTNFDISTQLVLVDLCSKKQHYSGVRYSDMQEFLREHIDIFNLIEQDLAVSIHDVV
jgi:hypothetical protein